MNDLMDLGGFTVRQWKEKRDILKENIDYSHDWEVAIDWYKTRLKRRYFDPMKRIENNSIGEGFSLVTIHCALIEHFASMTQGKLHNHRKNNDSPDYEYSSSSLHFNDFLKNSPLFSQYFAELDGNEAKFDTTDFYTNVRCALLHDACTRNNWRINTLSCGHDNPNTEIMTKDGEGIKRLYRDVLTDKLSEFVESYKVEIESDREKRLYFARKLDHLCEIVPDNSPWW